MKVVHVDCNNNKYVCFLSITQTSHSESNPNLNGSNKVQWSNACKNAKIEKVHFSLSKGDYLSNSIRDLLMAYSHYSGTGQRTV